MPVCTSCEEGITLESPHDIIREECWPGSAGQKSFYVFDQDLFQLYDLLIKNNPGLSESGFLRALEQFSERKGRVSACAQNIYIPGNSSVILSQNGVINRSIFHKAFREWRYCRYVLQKMQGLPLLRWPACYPDQHSVHFDGNRKL